MEKKQRVRIVGAAVGGVLAVAMAGGAYAAQAGAHQESSGQSKSFHYTVGDDNAAVVHGTAPKGKASSIKVSLKKNPHNTKALLEKAGGGDLGKPKTLHSGASSAQLAKNVPAGTGFKLYLYPSGPAHKYDVKGSILTAH